MLVQMRTIIKFENGGTNLDRYKSHTLREENEINGVARRWNYDAGRRQKRNAREGRGVLVKRTASKLPRRLRCAQRLPILGSLSSNAKEVNNEKIRTNLNHLMYKIYGQYQFGLFFEMSKDKGSWVHKIINLRHVLDQVSRSHNQITQKLHTTSILPKRTCCKNMKHPEVELNNKENPDLGIEDASEILKGFNLNYYHGFWLT
ncbi:hypothetical protein LXL04_016497 [Taraxacum kok-saghyz]